jgi:hypothetical protein
MFAVQPRVAWELAQDVIIIDIRFSDATLKDNGVHTHVANDMYRS